MQLKVNRLFGGRIWWIVFAILAMAFILVVEFFIFSASAPSADNIVKVKPVIKPQSVTSNVLFTGNIFWGRYINDWSQASDLKYAYPFSRLNEFNRSNYDAWISGLECPLVSSVNTTSAQQEAALQFNCRPEYLPEAAKFFTAMSLANNHTDNQGADGFLETRTHLEENDIQYFGHYDPDEIAENCEIIGMPVSIINSDKSTTKGNIPVALCGYHGVFKIPSDEAIAEMQKYSKYMPVIAMPHMGAEYKTSADELKTNVYRSMIDSGADMVIGDHPHWIQNTESYNGHLIVYSMGNFMFDQQDTAEVVRSAAINVVMKVNSNDSTVLNKWLDIGKSCAKFKDDCLEQIIAAKLSKLDMSYQFGAVGSNDSGKIAKPATAEQQTDILKRLNWQTTMQNLQSPYASL